MLPAARRGQAREWGREMLALPSGTLGNDERERLELLLDWLERSEPSRMTTFPGRGDGVHATCVTEIEALWGNVQRRTTRTVS